MQLLRSAVLGSMLLLAAPLVRAQPHDGTWTFDTYTPGVCSPSGGRHGGCPPGELVRIRVVTVAYGLVRPWHVTFLPGGTDVLVTELPGSLRIVRDGELDPEPIAGWPDEALGARSLNSVALHPDFERNRLLYFSYVKQRQGGETTVALARARFDGDSLHEVEEIFVADAWGTGATAGRAEVGPDGMIYLTVGDRDAGNTTDDPSHRLLAQDLGTHVGKVLRLDEDGTAPPDNPFVGDGDARPEIYTYGHRNVQGLAWHPDTGELWATEIGPMGGDELNRLVPGRNYGWPLVSLGRIYTGSLASEQSWWRPGIEMPVMHWTPAISPSSLMIYDGDEFPLWQGHYFIGALSGQQLQRVAFDQPPPQAERRESMLIPLDVRVRDVRQGPDGHIWLAVERDLQFGPGSARLTPNGSLLRIEPAAESEAPAQGGADIPRLSDGKPNLSGVWQALTTANWNIEPHGASAGPPEYGALLATPPGHGIVDGGEIPYLPEAQAQRARNYENRWTEDPEVKCYMPGVPRANYMPYPFQIFHSPGHMLIAYQFAGAARIINLEEHEPSAIDSWMGISNAHWEGDTLVVEVSGFNGLAWLDRAGNHASNALRVVERYTFAGPDAIDYEATLEDPQTFSRPWSMSFRLYRHANAHEHLMEFKCVPFTEELLYGELYRQPDEAQ